MDKLGSNKSEGGIASTQRHSGGSLGNYVYLPSVMTRFLRDGGFGTVTKWTWAMMQSHKLSCSAFCWPEELPTFIPPVPLYFYDSCAKRPSVRGHRGSDFLHSLLPHWVGYAAVVMGLAPLPSRNSLPECLALRGLCAV